MTFHILGMSSSQPTLIFFRGVESTNHMALTAKVDGFGMDYELPDKQDGICFGKYESFHFCCCRSNVGRVDLL